MKGKKDMNTREIDKKALKLFLGILLPTSGIMEGLYIAYGLQIMILFLMWVPFLAGIVTACVYYKGQHPMGIAFCKVRYILAGIFIPVVYLVGSYLISWKILGDQTNGLASLAAKMKMPETIPVGAFLIISFVLGLLGSCITAAGEELGWRGFLYPVLERLYGKTKAVVFSGLLWAGWHLPIIIGGRYQAETNVFYGIVMFVAVVMIMTIIFSWTRSVSGSVFPAILLHASHNLVDQTYCQQLSTNAKVPYFAGEQGFVTALVMLAVAGIIIAIWKKEEK